MIRVDINKKNLQAYRKIIDLAKKDKVFKGCGNPDNKWIMLKFNTKTEVNEWLISKIDK